MFLIVQGQLFIVTFFAPYPVARFFLKINYKMLYRLPASLVYRFADSHSISRSVNMLSNGASLSLGRGKTPIDTTDVATACLREKNVGMQAFFTGQRPEREYQILKDEWY